MGYVRKTKDVWVLYGNYGCGWEYLLSEESKAEILQRYREYVENAPQYQYKWRKERARI